MKIHEIVNEAVIGNYIPGKSAEIKDPEHGTTTTIDLTKPENLAKLKPNEQGQLEYDPDPKSNVQGVATSPQITPGTPVTVKSSTVDEQSSDIDPAKQESDKEQEDKELTADIGGDPTDDFIDDVEDHKYGSNNPELYRVKKLAGLAK